MSTPFLPMFRPLASFFLLVSTLLLASGLAAQQSALNSSACPCTLRGTVIDSVTGNPIHGALVLSPAGTAVSAFTDSEGKFQFDALPAGATAIQVAKPGYLSDDDYTSRNPKKFSFQVGPDARPAVIKLTPEGVIFGQVTDENGEPLEGFVVSLIYRNPGVRGIYRGSHMHVVTDDEGRFRLAALPPGVAYVNVRPNPYQGPAQVSARNASVPQGFALVFYPAASDMASASPVQVRPGKPLQLNFSLKREPFVRLSGTVSGFGPGQQVSINLQYSLGEPLPQQITFDPSTGDFATKWIPPGLYELSASLNDQRSTDGSSLSSARQSVNAHSSLPGIHLVLQPTVSIPVVVRGLPTPATDDESSPRLMLLLLAKGDNLRGMSRYASTANRGGDDSTSPAPPAVHGVEPGTYDVNAMIYNGASYYLESLRWGSVDLLNDPLVLNAAGAVPPIDVVLREGAATLSGALYSGDHPSAGAVVVFPPDHSRPPGFAFAGPDGAFQVTNLAPGAYRVIALENYSSLTLENQTLLKTISFRAQEVTLSPKQTATLRLPLVAMEE